MTGAELRSLRHGAGLSQRALAARWGVRHATVSEWERSEQVPAYIADAARWVGRHGLLTVPRRSRFDDEVSRE